MPIKSPTKLAAIQAKKQAAREMYSQNYPLREIGEALSMSHTWVWNVVNESVDNKDLTNTEQ